MIVADASGLIALGSVGAIEPFIDAFDVKTTPVTVDSIEAKSARHGPDGDGARATLALVDHVTLMEPRRQPIQTSRLDRGIGSCVALAQEIDAPFALTADRPAIHELRRLIPGDVVTPSIAVVALVRAGALTPQDARFRLAAYRDRRRGLEATLEDRERALIESPPT